MLELDQYLIKVEKPLIQLPLLAGIVASCLLPIGTFLGTSSIAYLLTSLLHLALIVTAVGYSLELIFQLARDAKKLGWIIALAIGVIVGGVLLLGAHPVTAKDALIHHLAVPKMWISDGQISEIKWHEWSYYPMLLQLVFTEFLTLGSEWASTCYHFLYLILLGGAVSYLVQLKTKDSELSVLSACLVICLPVSIDLASTPLVDLGLAY